MCTSDLLFIVWLYWFPVLTSGIACTTKGQIAQSTEMRWNNTDNLIFFARALFTAIAFIGLRNIMICLTLISLIELRKKKES